MTELRTPRLLLRPWRDTDLAPFAALNADPLVRRFFPNLLTPAESDASVARYRRHQAEHGFSFWAVEAPGVADFIGLVGLLRVGFAAPFNPPSAQGAARPSMIVETGWRLARAHWGQGYATEAARACLQHGFTRLALPEIVAFARPGNTASRRVMERIGMVHDAEGDFDHPALPEASPLRRQVLYRARA